MTKQNVYLIDLASGSNMNLLPLAIGLIGSYCSAQPDLKNEYHIHYRYLRQTGEQLAKSMKDPAVIGLSCYVWNYRGSLAAAKIIKQIFPNVEIVLGGFSVPRDYERISLLFNEHPYITALVHGEGEFTFAEYLREKAGNKNYQKIDGLSINQNSKAVDIISNPSVQRVNNLDLLPSPFLNGVFDELFKRYGQKITGALWETNRGCPYSCTFCDWGNSGVNKLKKYSMERLYEEISWISKNDFYYMFVSDANFGILKERDLEIAGWIANFRGKNNSPCHMVVNWTKNSSESIVDIADRLSLGGIACNVTLSIQSANQSTLEAIKRKNLSDKQIYNLKQKYHDKFIPTYMEIILGLPLDTLESFKSGLESVLTYRNEDRFFVYLCQLLVNTELESKESRDKYQIKSRLCKHTVSNRKFDWADENVEYEEFIVGNSTLSIEDWGKGYLTGYLLTVFHNHRLAFFLMNYLHHEFGIKRIDFIDFILDEVNKNSKTYPVLMKGIKHIDNQRQLMIDSVSTMSPLPGAEELIVLPHVGALVIMASHSDTVFSELELITQLYCMKNKIPISALLLSEVINYQKIRYPIWPKPTLTEHNFKTNIPLFFERLLNGKKPPDIKSQNIRIKLLPNQQVYTSYSDYGSTLVRGGLAVDLIDLEIEAGIQCDEHISIDYRLVRQNIIERNRQKLQKEYNKIH